MLGLNRIDAMLIVGVLTTLASPAVAADTGVWTQRAQLPVNRAEVGVAALGGMVYVVGGTEVVGKAMPQWDSSLNMLYNPATDRWITEAPLPRGLTHVGLAAMGGRLYAIGGFTTAIHMNPQNLAFVYDPARNTWKSLPALPSPRGSVAAIAVDGKLHVFGGRQADKVVKVSPPGAPEMFAAFGTIRTHDVYDPKTGQWSEASPMPGPPRDHMGVAVLDGKIHLFGGRVEDVSDNLDRHDVYDPKTDSWSTAAPLPRPRSAGAYTVLRGKIIYAGGECKPGGAPFSPNAYDDVTAYDPKSDSWASLTPLPSARHAFGAATIGDTAYFVGGAAVCGGGVLPDTLALTITN